MLTPQDDDAIENKIELRSRKGLLELELGPRITHLGQGFIMHILLMYKPIAKVRRIKAIQNITKLLETNQKKIFRKFILQ